MNLIMKQFCERDPEIVAKDLLGKKLIRRHHEEILEGIIVETEAYFGSEDPASRAYHGLKGYNRSMWGESGRLFIYNVHKYWMLNFIAHDSGVGGILIRAIEPTMGLETMKENRPVKRDRDLTSGPGKLTLALDVDRSLNGLATTDESCTVHVLDNEYEYEMGTSHRIGVTKDLPEHYRFYVKNNRFVSK